MGFMGIFDTIQDILSAGMDKVQDGQAIDDAVNEMYSMAGNEGQEAILDQGMDAFVTWAEEALSSDGVPPGRMSSAVQSAISGSAWEGSSQIWEAGADIVAEEVDQMLEDIDEEDESDDGPGGGTGIAFF